ncbi:hypothetical protein FPQ18DRAFT_241222, partial [Pyronema domesticum]
TDGLRVTIRTEPEWLTFDNLFLRDSCTCPKCLHPSTQQKLFATTDIPYDVTPKDVKIHEDGSVEVEWIKDINCEPWNNEPHRSIYSREWMNRYSKQKTRRAGHNDPARKLWNRGKMEKNVSFIDYEDYMKDEDKLWEAVLALSQYGLVFLKNCPKDEKAIEGMVERIGELKNTFYGHTWNVKSIKDSKNIAYTSLNLGHHMDLLYFESPPGLQFLHSLQNTTTGGSSIFADSFLAAEKVRIDSPSLFRSLCKFPVTYHYENDGHHYHYSRPVVVEDPYSEKFPRSISHVNWAPPFQAHFEGDVGMSESGAWREWVTAAKQFAGYIDEEDAQFELRLEEGMCAIFFNRRILHSRRAFDPASGDRWLKGAYVDIDAFYSKYRVLGER